MKPALMQSPAPRQVLSETVRGEYAVPIIIIIEGPTQHDREVRHGCGSMLPKNV